ncbi:minor capsid protein [Natrinema thermotolerans]|uniref:Minor capsid protein n=1 Tax=Natrinema thermotolerans TaxID=121872 RepID=A0AAF0PA56_9EURY|nr:minor capsid protein [Natrinema thermotolerans]WPH65842.1 head morphogenesis protein [Haloarchaeal virus HJTV-4]QCC60747.1 phage head morphogenesis protein [Natrinema thermotolerans]QCC61625.1 phage head morphogenesis protein [Natrinema thermotolerans]WMT07792.1 minor capsid protein [Natrinema thermotolerans]WMT08424.1 minor capsid protein [Natrinema thermotolerans]
MSSAASPSGDRHHLHAQQQDPTKTKTIRQTYAQRLRGAFGRINAAITESVISDDILGLRGDDSLADDEAQELLDTFADYRDYHDHSRTDQLQASLTAAFEAEITAVDEPPDLSTVPPDQRIERFREWLQTAQENEALEVIDRDENVWVRRAYERGLEDADTNLRQAGLDIEPTDSKAARELVEMPVHERKLQVLFSRNYAELEGITNEVSRQITRELADGIAAGENPTKMARRITDRVNKIGKTRSTVLARTETINAHTQSTIERYRQQGINSVGLEPEVQVQTAGDQRVCDQCASVAQRSPWTLDEFEGSENQPPIHPQCRCAVIPIVNEAAAAALEAHPHEFVAMYRTGAFVDESRERYEALAATDVDGAQELVAHFSPTQAAA